MAVSVIVSNLNGEAFLPRLLETLLAQRGVTAEIIIVDRHSKDGSAAILAKHPQVKVVTEPPETGLVSGYHRGYQAAQHEHLFFINEDMWFDADCLRLLEERIDLSKRIAAADPWQWSYDEKRWIHGVTRFRKVKWAINGIHPFYDNDYNVNLPAGTPVPWPCAGGFMMHRKAYEELGGWDTSFFLDNEDANMSSGRGSRAGAVSLCRRRRSITPWVCPTPARNWRPVRSARASAATSPTESGKTIVVWKYFSMPKAVFVGFAIWFVTFANNLLKAAFATTVGCNYAGHARNTSPVRDCPHYAQSPLQPRRPAKALAKELEIQPAPMQNRTAPVSPTSTVRCNAETGAWGMQDAPTTTMGLRFGYTMRRFPRASDRSPVSGRWTAGGPDRPSPPAQQRGAPALLSRPEEHVGILVVKEAGVPIRRSS